MDTSLSPWSLHSGLHIFFLPLLCSWSYGYRVTKIFRDRWERDYLNRVLLGFDFSFISCVRKKIRFWNSCWTSTETWDINRIPGSRTSDSPVVPAPHRKAHFEVWEISVQTLVSSYFCVTLCICLLNSWITFPSRGTKCHKLSRLKQHTLLSQFCRSEG